MINERRLRKDEHWWIVQLCTDWQAALLCLATIRFSRIEIDICTILRCGRSMLSDFYRLMSNYWVRAFSEMILNVWRFDREWCMVHQCKYTWYIVLLCCHNIQFTLYTIFGHYVPVNTIYRLTGCTPVRCTTCHRWWAIYFIWRFGLTLSGCSTHFEPKVNGMRWINE